MDRRTEANQPNGLLAALVPYGVLVHPEVALTRGLCWLLGLEGANGALDGLIRRNDIEPRPDAFWLTEVPGADGRTDLECFWDDPPRTHVLVEAKIGHTLDFSQLAAYRGRLPPEGGLIVVLVPEGRRVEAEGVVADYLAAIPDESVQLDVWTFDDVTRCLEEHLPTSSDVAQFKGLVLASGALDVFPLDEAELLDDNDDRREDIWRVVSEASFGVFNLNNPAGGDPHFDNRRWVGLAPYPTFFSVGVGRKSRQHASKPEPWAWIRIPNETAYGRIAQSVLEHLRPGETERDNDGLYVPLVIPTHTPGSVMVQRVREQIEGIGAAIRAEIEAAVEANVVKAPKDLQDGIAAVLGIPPIDQGDLLDDSDSRFADIELIVREAAKSLRGGKLLPRQSDDAFANYVYLPVEPFGTFIQIAFGRKAPSVGEGAHPWAWLRVTQGTPHAEIAFGVLERLPGPVAYDHVGRAVPIDIPTGESGPTMLQAVRDQLDATMKAIAEDIRAAHPEV